MSIIGAPSQKQEESGSVLGEIRPKQELEEVHKARLWDVLYFIS